MTDVHEAPIDPRARRRAAKKAEILAAAWTLAHRDGVPGISLRDLADMVDLRQPSLYAYFESKHDLYDAMFAAGNRELLEVMARNPPDRDPRIVIVDLVRLLLNFATDDVVRYQLLFQRPIVGFEPSPASYQLAIDFYEIVTDRLAAAAVTDPADVDVFTALVAGLADQQVANDPGGDRWVRHDLGSPRCSSPTSTDVAMRRSPPRRDTDDH